MWYPVFQNKLQIWWKTSSILRFAEMAKKLIQYFFAQKFLHV